MDEPVEIELYCAWWLQPYFWMLATVCAITGLEPDEKKVIRMVDRAIRIKVN